MVSVPVLSIVGMGFTLLISVALPVAILIAWHKKTGAKPINALWGALTFTVFAMGLEQILHGLVARPNYEYLQQHVWLLALYGGTAAAVFEEFGRLFTMKVIMKKSLNKQNGIMYGIGHGGFEAILVAGLTMLGNIITSVAINSGQGETMFAALDEASIERLSALWTTQSYQFFMGGIERISAIFLHICLSYLVFRAVKYGKKSNFALALLLHFLVDAGTVLLKEAVSILALEVILLVAVAGVVFMTLKLYKQDSENAPEGTAEA